MADVIMRPLDSDWSMQKRWTDGRPASEIAAEFIKPNDRLTSFERIELYNKQYWFRIVDSFYEDYPGLRAILGDAKFSALARAYLNKYPSANWTMRDLGRCLESFLREEPKWSAPHGKLALDMARFEWAQIEAFDNEILPILTEDDLHRAVPSRTHLKLQPYLRLLELGYPVDDFLLATKRKSVTALRGEASNAVEEGRRARRLKRVPLPKPKKTWLAVHRVDNELYYKNLTLEGFRILAALENGATLAAACEEALKDKPDPTVEWPGRIQRWFQNWMELGWFCR